MTRSRNSASSSSTNWTASASTAAGARAALSLCETCGKTARTGTSEKSYFARRLRTFASSSSCLFTRRAVTSGSSSEGIKEGTEEWYVRPVTGSINRPAVRSKALLVSISRTKTLSATTPALSKAHAW